MKIILSHDVDHLYWKEHYFKDIYLPGTLVRNTRGFLKKKITWSLYKKRIKCWDRIHKLPELSKFYSDNKIKANFFFGMDNALGLSYNYKNSEEWIKLLLSAGHKVGVHGISFSDKEKVKMEHERFKEVSELENFGIRTHYLRLSGFTHELFENQGYLFDSSIESITNVFKVNHMWNFPISIMDVSLVKNAQLNQDINIWKESTIKRLELAENREIPYFVVNFHDLYFSDSFPVIKEWYIWLIEMLKSKKYQFITFEEAIIDLNKETSKIS